MKYKQRYQKIVDELIAESFPELKGKKVFVDEKRASDWRAHVRYTFSGMEIVLSHQLRRFSEKKIKRILIHELCHLSIFKKWGVVLTNLDYIYYRISKKHRSRSERKANLLMIKKGYGKLVLFAMKENLRRGLSYSLNEQEIKSYAEKIGKW